MVKTAGATSWQDDYYRSSERIVLTETELMIPGIRTFGWHDMKRAIPALESHYHENCFEVTFVTKGNISFSADDREYAIYGGDAFLTAPNEVHSTNEAPMSVGEICWLQLDISKLDGFLGLSRTAAEALISTLFQVRHHCIRTDNGMTARLLKTLISTVLKAPQDFNRFQIANYVVTYLYLLLKFADTSGLRVTMDIASACDFVNKNLLEELMLEDLAAVSCLSVSQFKQKFKSQIGISPRNYINQQKIERIKEILTRGSVLTQVASDYGFCNSSYFSVVFKKYTGKTPSEYIKSLS